MVRVSVLPGKATVKFRYAGNRLEGGGDPGIKIDLRNYHHLHWWVGYGKQRCMISAYKQRNNGTQ